MIDANAVKRKQLSARLLYVAGNGRSGSTLLDLALGNNVGCFSAGELTFVSREGILDEYCGCGKTISSCDLWRDVFTMWEAMQLITVPEYRALRRRYEMNRSLPRLILNLIKPSAEFRSYCSATEALFIAIQEVTKASTIIDSSKTPGRICILARFSKPTVIHICRNFSGVLNSMSKGRRKNVEEGVEVDLHATAPRRAFVSWFLNNLLVEILRGRLPRRRLHYRDLVSETDDALRSVDPEFGYDKGASISANHMLAGNRMRLKSNITIDPDIGFQYRNLSPGVARFGRIVDGLLWFWSKR